MIRFYGSNTFVSRYIQTTPNKKLTILIKYILQKLNVNVHFPETNHTETHMAVNERTT